MTDTDDLVRLRRAVLDSEPPFTMNPHTAIGEGRRLALQRGHRRRLGAVAVLTTAAAVAGIASAGHLGVLPVDRLTGVSGDRAVGAGVGGPSANPPADDTTAWVPVYTVTEAGAALLDESERLLGPSVGALGVGVVTASDESGADVPLDDFQTPTWMGVTFTPDRHQHLSISIARAASEAEGDPASYCEEGTAIGHLLSCEVETTNGFTIITTTGRVVPQVFGGRRFYVAVVTGNDLPPGVKPGPISIQRTVKAIRSEDVVSYATETVALDTENPAEVTSADAAALEIPSAALAAAATSTDINLPTRQLFLTECTACDDGS